MENLQLTSDESLSKIVHLVITAANPQKVQDLLAEGGTLRNLIQRIEPGGKMTANVSKSRVSWKKALAALAPMAAGVVVSCTPTGAPDPTEATRAATQPPPTETRVEIEEPTATKEEPEPTETAVPSYLESQGFSIISNTEESFKFRKEIVTFDFDILAGAGGPELPAEIDPETLYENIMQRFEVTRPVAIKLEYDSAANRYFYILEENTLTDKTAEEPIEYPEGTHLFPLPNDIVPAQVFAEADIVAWSRSGSNTVEQYKLERVEDAQNNQESNYQLRVIAAAGPPDWSFQEPEQPITYSVDQAEIEGLGLEIPERQEAKAEGERVLESRPTSPEELFDLSQYREVFNQTVGGTTIRISYDHDQTYTENGVEKPYFVRHVRPEYINEDGEVDNQELARMLLDWSIRIQRDTNKIDGSGRYGAAPEQPFLTVIDAGQLYEAAVERVSTGEMGEDEVLNNLPFYKKIEMRINEIDEIRVVIQGALRAEERPLSPEDLTLPITLDGEKTLKTIRGVNLSNSKLPGLVTSILFEDEAGKTTLVVFSNGSSLHTISTPEFQERLLAGDYRGLESRYASMQIQALINAAYAASLHPQFTERLTRQILGGGLGVIPLSLAEETKWTEIIRNEYYPVIANEDKFQGIVIDNRD